jgi:hypothetical protein
MSGIIRRWHACMSALACPTLLLVHVSLFERWHAYTCAACSAPSVLSTYRNGWALTEAAARWARSVVWSRSFTVRHMADGSHNVVAMVPVLDMIDHSSEREVVWHTGMEGTDDFQFVSLQGVPKVSTCCQAP